MTAAPCIGTIGKIAEDAPNDRSKGTLTIVQTSQAQLLETLRGIARDHTFGTRLSVRLFLGSEVDPYALGSIPWHDDLVRIEALIPVAGHPLIDRFVYFGACAASRRQPAQTFADELRLYESVSRRSPLSRAEGITLEVLRPPLDHRTIARILEIYRTRYDAYLTEFSEQWLCEMVERNTVAVARGATDTVMSVCIAELATFHFQGLPSIEFAELTDAATAKVAEGRGIYSTLKRWMVAELRRDCPHRVITTEARANSRRVLGSNARIGFLKAGFQPAHCVISSSSDEAVPQIGQYGDLVVFTAPF